MKYIRTKDGRIITPIANEDIFDTSETRNGENVLKVSDTIEELCDKFVWIDNECRRGFICNIEFVENCTKSHEGRLYGDSKFIFGAIWTDKGLIYVAKMNKKGEFELL